MLRPKRGVLFGSRVNVEDSAIFVENVSSANSGASSGFLNAESREHGFCEFIVTGKVLFTDLNSGAVVTLIPAASPAAGMPTSQPQIPQGLKCYVTDLYVSVDSTGAAGGTNIQLQDNAGSPVTLQTIALAQLGANARWTLGMTGATGDLLGGPTVSKGLQWAGAGTFTGAGTFSYRVQGYFAP